MPPALHIGVDDTDSRSGGCTTYLAALLIDQLLKLGLSFSDYPNLVRLNPNIPWKTRGNGAVALRVEGPSTLIREAKDSVLKVIDGHASMDVKGTDPGVVFLEGPVPDSLRSFASLALSDVVALRLALKLVKASGAEAVGYKNARGVIGALSAVGETLQGDHTYELIAYRTTENWGKPRRVDEASVLSMDEATRPETFNNVDREIGRILITPRGPDPILYGVRGETPAAVHRAHLMLKVTEPIKRWLIFRTNHGTDGHFSSPSPIKEARSYRSVVIRGSVSKSPGRERGGHVLFAVADETGEIQCAAYEPTGSFRDEVQALVIGDEVMVFGGVRRASATQPRTVNLEKLEVVKLAPAGVYHAPSCPVCGRRLKSEGRMKGYGCERCDFRDRQAKKVFIPSPRHIRPGFYLPPARAHRHFTRPVSRYGSERTWAKTRLFEPWHWP